MIVYLHGFNSSPASFKARLTGERMAALGRGDDFVAPALSDRPARAFAQGLRLVESAGAEAVTLIGSSLGGFYATAIAERTGCRAVLVNPAVHAHELLAAHVGRQKNLYTGVEYDFTPAHLAELAALDVAAITRPGRYLLVATTGDEVLDYRAAVAFCAGAEQIIVDGGDHGFAGFGEHLDRVLRFAGVLA